MRRRAPGSQRGFTLIELGIVIALAAILAGAVTADFLTNKRTQLALKTAEDVSNIMDAAKWYFVLSNQKNVDRVWPGQLEGECREASATAGQEALVGGAFLDAKAFQSRWNNAPYSLTMVDAGGCHLRVTATNLPSEIISAFSSFLPGDCVASGAATTTCSIEIGPPGTEPGVSALNPE